MINTTKREGNRVLVVVPTLGQRNELLKKTLESIKQQAPIPYDIVMVFPLSNTKTKQLAKEYSALMVDDPGGMSAAVNAGVAMAKPAHEYITWIGDDDLLTPGSLATSIEALEQDHKAVVAFGYCEYINSKGERIFTSKAGRFAPWIMTWGPNLVPMPGLVLRTSALRNVGEFDVNNKYSMDLDMLLRLRKVGKFINTKRIQACFRWHASSQTVANRPKVIAETEQVKRKYLPKYLLPIAPIWERPVRFATIIAAKRVNKLASRP